MDDKMNNGWNRQLYEELRQETVRKVQEVKNDSTLTDKEKNKRIIELATELGKAYFEGLARTRLEEEKSSQQSPILLAGKSHL